MTIRRTRTQVCLFAMGSSKRNSAGEGSSLKHRRHTSPGGVQRPPPGGGLAFDGFHHVKCLSRLFRPPAEQDVPREPTKYCGHQNHTEEETVGDRRRSVNPNSERNRKQPEKKRKERKCSENQEFHILAPHAAMALCRRQRGYTDLTRHANAGREIATPIAAILAGLRGWCKSMIGISFRLIFDHL